MDESDVYVDVHKAIRRLTPAPRARKIQAEAAAAAAAAVQRKPNDNAIVIDVAESSEGQTIKVGSYDPHREGGHLSQRPKTAIFMKRRSSADVEGRMTGSGPYPVKASLEEMKQQLRLGPANRAAHPRSTRGDIFKIKQGLAPSPIPGPSGGLGPAMGSSRMPGRSISMMNPTIGASETTPLLGGDDTIEEAESPESSRSKVNGGRHES